LPRTLPASATIRPQGLVTLSAVYALRARAGFVSHRRRSWDLPFGAFSSRKVFTTFPRRKSPRTVQPAGDPVADYDGPAQRAAVSGLLPFRESLAIATGLVRRPLVAPLGFTLLGSASENLARAFAWTPPARFLMTQPYGRAERRLGVSIGFRLASSGCSAKPGRRTRQPF